MNDQLKTGTTSDADATGAPDGLAAPRTPNGTPNASQAVTGPTEARDGAYAADTSPATELRTAAFQLRNPFHHPGLKTGIDPELAHPLADWLDLEADIIAARTAQDGTDEYAVDLGQDHALTIARLINGQAVTA